MKRGSCRCVRLAGIFGEASESKGISFGGVVHGKSRLG